MNRPTQVLLRTRPSPRTSDQGRRLRGARPAGPPPRPSAEPVHAGQIVTVHVARVGCHQPTKDYVARRTAEGKTKTEIMRCLKRYTAREVFPHLLADTLTLQGAKRNKTAGDQLSVRIDQSIRCP